MCQERQNDRGAGFKSISAEKAGRPPERKGKLPKGWIPARVSVSGTPHKMRRTVTGSGALSSWTEKEILLP